MNMENENGGCLGNMAVGALGCGGCIVHLAIILAITCLLSKWLCDIDPDKTYSWYSGIWQGIWFFPNLIRSIFTDGLFKAENYTTGYNIWWWIMVIGQCLGILGGGASNSTSRY